MKRKGITIWEQHLERIVVGAALLFFAFFAALQLMSNPNEVEIGAKKTVSPAEIDDLLLDKALDLQARLDPDARPEIQVTDHEPVLDQFMSALDGGVSPAETLAVSHPRVLLARDVTGTGADVTYAQANVAAPHSVVSEQYFDAVAADVVAALPALQEFVPQAPHDLSWITVAAVFNTRQVIDEYEAEGSNGEAPIPVSWYRNRIDILDVGLEREELVDGVWTNRQRLDVIPGQTTYRSRLEGSSGLSFTRDVGVMVNELSTAGVQEAIVRPEFYDLENDSWSPPDPRAVEEPDQSRDLTPEEREIYRLAAKIRSLTSDRERKVAQLTELGGSLEDMEPPPPEETKPPPGRPGQPAGGGGSGGGGAGGSGDRRGPPKESRKPPGAGGGGMGGFGAGSAGGAGGQEAEKNKKVIERLKKKIEGLDRKIRDARKRLAVLAPDEQVEDEAMNSDEIMVWAHDITIEPRKTYRYRFSVSLYNPFYGRKVNLLDEQHGLAESITLTSAPSDWSKPRKAIGNRKLWVVKAFAPGSRNAGELGMGHAMAEVFRFHHGRWWMQTFPVQPGDRVGWEKTVSARGAAGGQSIDYGTDWFVLDVVEDINADRQAKDRGWGASVLLQNLEDESLTILGDPRAAADDPERERLKEAVQEADRAGDLASAG